MELTHAANSTAHADTDSILAAFLEQGGLPDIAKRVNMSLAALAQWVSDNAKLLASVHQLLTTRCKLLALHLEAAALSALASVSAAGTSSDDEKLRERSLERRRKAANAIIRHRAWLQRTLHASPGPHAPSASLPAVAEAPSPGLPNTQWRMANAASSPAASMPNASSLDAPMPHALMPSSSRSASSTRAARKLAALAVTPRS